MRSHITDVASIAADQIIPPSLAVLEDHDTHELKLPSLKK